MCAALFNLGGMHTVSTLGVTVVSTHQVATLHAIQCAQEACEKAKKRAGSLIHADVTGFNAAVEHVLPTSPDVARLYIRTVTYIVSSAGANRANRVITGAVTVGHILLAMTSHTGLADVQSDGAFALAALAYQSSSNIAGMIDMGLLTILCAASDTHIASFSVQYNVCCALSTIVLFSPYGASVLSGSQAEQVAARAKATHQDIWYADCLLKKLCLE